MASCKSAISNEPTFSLPLRPHELPLETEGLPVDLFRYPTSSVLSVPTQSPMDDPSDGSGKQARHDTGNTCVHRIEVGPSFSQKCASESCTPHEHTSAKGRQKSTLTTWCYWDHHRVGAVSESRIRRFARSARIDNRDSWRHCTAHGQPRDGIRWARRSQGLEVLIR